MTTVHIDFQNYESDTDMSEVTSKVDSSALVTSSAGSAVVSVATTIAPLSSKVDSSALVTSSTESKIDSGLTVTTSKTDSTALIASSANSKVDSGLAITSSKTDSTALIASGASSKVDSSSTITDSKVVSVATATDSKNLSMATATDSKTLSLATVTDSKVDSTATASTASFKVATTTISLNQIAGTYDLFTCSVQAVLLNTLSFKLPTGAVGGALTSISIQTDDVTAGTIISSSTGIVTNLTSEAELVWEGEMRIDVGTKIQLTIAGGAHGSAYTAKVVAEYSPIVAGGLLS